METFLPYAFWTPVRFTDKLAALNTFTVEYAPYTKCSIYNMRWHTKGRIPWAPKAGDINHSSAVFPLRLFCWLKGLCMRFKQAF